MLREVGMLCRVDWWAVVARRTRLARMTPSLSRRSRAEEAEGVRAMRERNQRKETIRLRPANNQALCGAQRPAAAPISGQNAVCAARNDPPHRRTNGPAQRSRPALRKRYAAASGMLTKPPQIVRHCSQSQGRGILYRFTTWIKPNSHLMISIVGILAAKSMKSRGKSPRTSCQAAVRTPLPPAKLRKGESACRIVLPLARLEGRLFVHTKRVADNLCTHPPPPAYPKHCLRKTFCAIVRD
jgi:hypothetical protein